MKDICFEKKHNDFFSKVFKEKDNIKNLKNNREKISDKLNNIHTNGSKSINRYLKLKTELNKIDENISKVNENDKLYDYYVNNIEMFKDEKPQSKKKTIINPNTNININKCQQCGGNLEYVNFSATSICSKCGFEILKLTNSEKQSYSDQQYETSHFAYQRMNHFKESLSHLQARETTKIPEEVYDMIRSEMKKERMSNQNDLTYHKVKCYLQKYISLGYNKYYENINQIIYHITGNVIFSLKPDEENTLCKMFNQIQEPFKQNCPPDRVNFLSYGYVIRKFCELLGGNYKKYCTYFNYLKSVDKLREQDDIWKLICKDLDWRYIPSINK